MEFLTIRDGATYVGERPFLLQGMGLGGWLLPEGYMWKFYTKCDRPRRMEKLICTLCGEEYEKAFWQRYYEYFITEKDIAWIAQQGLNSVRLPLNSRHLFSIDETGRVVFNDAVLQCVDRCLAWCKKYGLYLFLDMHGAPGGQTGQNIDDSENDAPELFIDEKNKEQLIQMWLLIAQRYAEEEAIGGYDLLNEPITKWNSQYYPQLIPLYRKLIHTIRGVDQRHIIVLEGVHWATDFSVFEELSPEEASHNIMLEFHKYWSNPDIESLEPFVEAGKRLNTPLWMGEGGENNQQWYTYVFPMYERAGIGWCFWAYKKMDTPNSPVTFAMPNGWKQITDYLDGKAAPPPKNARMIFDAFLDSIAQSHYHTDVMDAILRRPPLEIPAAAYDVEKIANPRLPGAIFRQTSKATIIFADRHTGDVNWQRYGGEPQPHDQKILLRLRHGDAVAYQVRSNKTLRICVEYTGSGMLMVQDMEYVRNCTVHLSQDGLLWINCVQGQCDLDTITIIED